MSYSGGTWQLSHSSIFLTFPPSLDFPYNLQGKKKKKSGGRKERRVGNPEAAASKMRRQKDGEQGSPTTSTVGRDSSPSQN